MNMIENLLRRKVLTACEGKNVRCACNKKVIRRSSVSSHVKSNVHIAWVNSQKRLREQVNAHTFCVLNYLASEKFKTELERRVAREGDAMEWCAYEYVVKGNVKSNEKLEFCATIYRQLASSFSIRSQIDALRICLALQSMGFRLHLKTRQPTLGRVQVSITQHFKFERPFDCDELEPMFSNNLIMNGFQCTSICRQAEVRIGRGENINLDALQYFFNMQV